MPSSQTFHNLTRSCLQTATGLLLAALVLLAAPRDASAAGHHLAAVDPIDADPPISGTSAYVATEDTPLALIVPFGDTRQGLPVLTLGAPPAHGTLSGTLPNVIYTPDADYSGTDAFTVIAHYSHPSSDAVTTDVVTTTLAIEVLAVNDAPVAASSTMVAMVPYPLELTLEADDAEGDPLTFAVVTLPQHGTLSGSAPHLIYLPDPNFAGTDTLAFVAYDGNSTSNTATISIKYVPLDIEMAEEPAAASQIFMPVITR